MSIALHPERRDNVGASECAALWSLGWETRYSLHARKAGLIPHDSDNGNESLSIGRILEPAVAALVMERTGWQLNKVRRYSPHPTVTGMGASLDYEVVAHADGPGVCEIKTVDAAVFKRWEGAPPIQYELQLQHQLACINRSWGVLAMLVSNRHLEIFTRKREPDAIARIEAEIPIFWNEVRRGTPPAPDYHADTATLLEVFKSATQDKTIDLSLDEEAQALAVSYKQLAEVEKGAEEGKRRIKARLLAKMEDAEVALLPYGKVTSKLVLEREMPAYVKRSYRTWSVTVEDIDEKGAELNSPAGIETRCKTCGKKIVFAMLGRKYIPLDMVAPIYALHDDGTASRVVAGEVAAMCDGKKIAGIYVTHFATCPQASVHSKSKKKEVADAQAQDSGESDRAT